MTDDKTMTVEEALVALSALLGNVRSLEKCGCGCNRRCCDSCGEELIGDIDLDLMAATLSAALQARDAKVERLTVFWRLEEQRWLQRSAALSARAEQAEAECARLEQDARRYRWLREGDNDEHVLRNADGTPLKVLCPDAAQPFLLRNEKLDEAIDAMIEKGP